MGLASRLLEHPHKVASGFPQNERSREQVNATMAFMTAPQKPCAIMSTSFYGSRRLALIHYQRVPRKGVDS